MSGGKRKDELDDVRAILEAQKTPKIRCTLPSFSVLPSIGPKSAVVRETNELPKSRPSTTTASRPPTTSFGFSVLPKILPLQKRASISDTALNTPKTPKNPLYPIPRANIGYTLDFNTIDETEILRPTSSDSQAPEELVEVDAELDIAEIPETFSEFRDLPIILDEISFELFEQLRQKCSTSDIQNMGLLTTSTILSILKKLDENFSFEVWQKLLETIAPTTNILIDYEIFIDVLDADKHSREALINLPEYLVSDDNESVFSHLPSRPSSSQEQREKGRARLLLDFEVILANHPEIDIDRFKEATDKKNIEIEEFRILLQMYGMTEHVINLEQRIIDCFQTHDGLFCFSAFVGCLDQLKPHLLRRPDTSLSHLPIVPSWSKAPLPKIGEELDDSGVLADMDSTIGSKVEQLKID